MLRVVTRAPVAVTLLEGRASSIFTSGRLRNRFTTAGLKQESVSTRHDCSRVPRTVRRPWAVSSCSVGAKQSMHSSGSMMRMRSNGWMQSTGETSTQENLQCRCRAGDDVRHSSESSRGTLRSQRLGETILGELVDELRSAFDQRRLGRSPGRNQLCEHAGGPPCRCGSYSRGWGCRATRATTSSGSSARDVRDHEVRRFHAVGRHESMALKQTLQFKRKKRSTTSRIVDRAFDTTTRRGRG